jgi:hypothetical protein
MYFSATWSHNDGRQILVPIEGFFINQSRSMFGSVPNRGYIGSRTRWYEGVGMRKGQDRNNARS